ncbi:MAG: Zinc transporter ZupT [Cyanobacteria bacterium RYN_339]|nr:Zinc transporter ZupT [Cyanobacteria bacterium RYN_339]
MTASPLVSAVVYSGLAGLCSFLGALLIFKLNDRVKPVMPLVISFAAGTLLAVAFMDLLPEALELAGPKVLPFVLASFIVFYFLENVLHYHSHHHTDHDHLDHHHPVGLIAFCGMSFHSLIDGIIIGVGFEVSPALGLVTTLGLLAHEIPQGVAVASILLHARYTPARTLLLSTVVALATPLGAIATVLLTHDLPRPVVGEMLGVAAGTFLYVAASDLIPESHAAKHAWTGLMLVVGVLVVAATLTVIK